MKTKFKVVSDLTNKDYVILRYPLRPVWDDPVEESEWEIVQRYSTRDMASHACKAMNEPVAAR